jgi:hypothetical protein
MEVIKIAAIVGLALLVFMATAVVLAAVIGGDDDNQPESNGDKVRRMNNEKLSEIIICPYKFSVGDCEWKGITCNECCLEWLRKNTLE